MVTTIPETQKKPGLCYAVTNEGWELPVIDITHEAFAECPSEEQLRAISQSSLISLKKSNKIPAFLRRFLAGRMLLTRDAYKPYVGGMTSYLQKLGPSNLGNGYATPKDRQIASTIGPVCMRMRLRQMAHLMADILVPMLEANPSAPLHLINIGGGPASDTTNLLIVINKSHPELLGDRRIVTYVLDLEEPGPHFGERAIAALQTPGAPLHGVSSILMHLPYDWDDTTALYGLLQQIDVHGGVVLASSEGALFEYGSDTAIKENLRVLNESAPPGATVVGSVLRDEKTTDPGLVLLRKSAGLPVRLLGVEEFAQLATEAGWVVSTDMGGNPIYHIVSLRRAG